MIDVRAIVGVHNSTTYNSCIRPLRIDKYLPQYTVQPQMRAERGGGIVQDTSVQIDVVDGDNCGDNIYIYSIHTYT